MAIVRRIILTVSVFIGVWVALSFIGVMFNTGNAGFWTTSLMWSLLASLVLMPMLVVAHHANTRAERKARQSAPPLEKQPSFVDRRDRRQSWPVTEGRSVERD